MLVGGNQRKHFLSTAHKQKVCSTVQQHICEREKITVITNNFQGKAHNVMSAA